ncbi:MAG: DUF488 domain-containing protein [candidate division WOR-3 bacterium]
MRLYTIGTDHRRPYDFARLLCKYGIQVVFDVRPLPEATEAHFRRDGLQALAATQRADYVFFGNELGGPGNASMAEWLGSDGFRRGIDIIRHKALTRVCCILCSERSPEFCHRRQIADELARAGIEVVHILDEGVFWQPPSRPARRERSGRRDRRGRFRRR